MGNLGHTPELRTTKNGKITTTVSVATKDRWVNKHTQQTTERTIWHKVVFWDGMANTIAKHTATGDKIWVRGELSIREYVDNDNIKRQRVEVIARNLKLISTKRTSSHDDSEVALNSTDYVEDIGDIADE